MVDDEPPVRELMARTLAEAGYTVHAASHGQEALAVADRVGGRIDLVVTDLRMEPVGGAELAERLFARGLATLFLFVTGFGSAGEYNPSFGPLLLKPFSPDRLLQLVEQLLF